MHAAHLVSGERVVLKVQHPEVAALMAQDLQQSERLAAWLFWLEPSIDTRGMMAEATEVLSAELDYGAAYSSHAYSGHAYSGHTCYGFAY